MDVHNAFANDKQCLRRFAIDDDGRIVNLGDAIGKNGVHTLCAFTRLPTI